jgi:hypothetical protein
MPVTYEARRDATREELPALRTDSALELTRSKGTLPKAAMLYGMAL